MKRFSKTHFLMFMLTLAFVTTSSTCRSSSCSQNSNGTQEVTAEKASELIAVLPEVQAFSKQLRNSSTGASLIIRQEPHDSDSQRWEFYVGENHPDHTVMWMRFAVEKKTGKIRVYDINSGKYIALSEWRQKNK